MLVLRHLMNERMERGDISQSSVTNIQHGKTLFASAVQEKNARIGLDFAPIAPCASAASSDPAARWFLDFLRQFLNRLDRHPLDVNHFAAQPTAHTNSEHSDN